MKKLYVIICLALSFCKSKDDRKSGNFVDESTRDSSFRKVVYYDSLIGFTSDSLKIILRNDTLFFNVRGKQKYVLWRKPDFFPEGKAKLIYVIRGDKMAKESSVEVGNFIAFAILDEKDRGQLYSYSAANEKILNDKKFGRDFLLSSSGIFIADVTRERIMTIGSPKIDETSKKMKTAIFIFGFGKDAYEPIGSVSIYGEMIYDDSLVDSFIKKYNEVGGRIESIKLE